ncbi:MAG: AtpZ/AtpI family protein [Sporolactobacillus sp.]
MRRGSMQPGNEGTAGGWMMADGKGPMSPLQMAAMVSSMGFEIFAFIILSALFGNFLDAKLRTAHLWLPICAVIGLFLGLTSCFFTLKSFIRK